MRHPKSSFYCVKRVCKLFTIVNTKQLEYWKLNSGCPNLFVIVLHILFRSHSFYLSLYILYTNKGQNVSHIYKILGKGCYLLFLYSIRILFGETQSIVDDSVLNICATKYTTGFLIFINLVMNSLDDPGVQWLSH